MKTTLKILTSFVVLVLLTIACGSSGSKPSQGELPESNSQTEVGEAVKQTSHSVFDFEDSVSGQLPEGWSPYYTGPGGADWKVVDDNGNKVLAQLYSDRDRSYNA